MSATSGKILSCYYTGSDLEPEGVDGGIMTHLMCGWILMSKDGTVAPQDAKTAERFRGFVLLKNKWPSLKVLVSSGGGPAIAPIARNPTLRANYIHSVVDLLDEYGFDGLDVDWEYPVWNGKKCDKEICVLLMRELRETFNSRPRRMLLTMASMFRQQKMSPPQYSLWIFFAERGFSFAYLDDDCRYTQSCSSKFHVEQARKCFESQKTSFKEVSRFIGGLSAAPYAVPNSPPFLGLL